MSSRTNQTTSRWREVKFAFILTAGLAPEWLKKTIALLAGIGIVLALSGALALSAWALEEIQQ